LCRTSRHHLGLEPAFPNPPADHRFRHEQVDVYTRCYLHPLVRDPSGLLFRERRAVLYRETLRRHGELSFIL